MNYKIGDTIRPKDDTGEYTISAVGTNQITGIDEHGFTHVFGLDEVVLVRHQAIIQKIESVAFVPKKETGGSKKSLPHIKNQKKNVLEVDLHAGVLLGTTTGMTNHEILIEQLHHGRVSIEKARQSGYNHVVLIHGKGSGKLRQELHHMLAGMDRLTYYDASFADYSSGATEVFLR